MDTQNKTKLNYCDLEKINAYFENSRQNARSYGHIVVRVKPDFQYIFVSKNIFEVYGFCDLHDFIEQTTGDCRKLIHPDDYEKVSTYFNQITTFDRDHDYTYRIRNKDGEYCWVAQHNSYVKDMYDATYVYATFINLSEKILQKEWLSSMLYDIPIGIFGITGIEQRPEITFASKSLLIDGNLKDSEYRKELMNQWMQRVFTQDRKIVKQAMTLISHHSMVDVVFRYCYKTNNSGYQWIKASGQACVDSDGNRREFVTCMQISDNDGYDIENAYVNFKDDNAAYELSDGTEHAYNQNNQVQSTSVKYRSKPVNGISEFPEMTGNDFIMFEYDIKGGILTLFYSDKNGTKPVRYENVPESIIHIGVIDKDSIRACQRFADQIKSGVECNKTVIKVRSSHKKKIWCQLYCRTQYDQQGRPDTAIGYCLEITGYKRIEKEYLYELEGNMSVDDYNLIVKTRINISKNMVEYSNSRLFDKEIKGIRYTEILKFILSKCVRLDHKNKLIDNLSIDVLKSNYKKSKTHYNFEVQIYIGESSLYWLKIAVRLYQQPNTNDIMACIYIFDIQKEMLAKKISSYVLEQNYEYVGYLNTSNGKISFVSYNDQLELEYETALSYDVELKKLVLDKVLEGDRKHVYDEMELTTICNKLSENKEYSCEQYLFTKHGLRIKHWQYRYLDSLQRCIIVTRQDKTCDSADEIKRTEQINKALAVAKSANAAKTEFLSRMSHDIRTPLNSIINLTKLALIDKDNKENVTQNLQQIEIASQFLQEMMNDILDMSKIERGQISLKPEVYTYEKFIDYIKAIILPLCQQKNITFLYDLGDTNFDIYVDIMRFNQIFFNILSNAVKYTPIGGTVSYSMKNGHVIDDVLYGDFCIKDNGIGMSKEFIKRAFVPFEQEIHTGRSYEGSGLGLAIVKSIVDLMHGKITLKSEPGLGTEVIIHLGMPLAKKSGVKEVTQSDSLFEASQNQSQDDIDDRNDMNHGNTDNMNQTNNKDDILKGKHVLIVEDYKPNSLIVTKILELYGMTSDWVDNGRKAVNQFVNCEKGTYDLILMDIRMPVMDGLTATQLIRKSGHADSEQIPIVAMTADVFDEDRRKALNCGITDYMTKPIDMNRMKKILVEQLSK